MSKTAQEVFNAAWKHAVVDKKPPAIRLDLDVDGLPTGHRCMYRTPDNNCCLIGASLTDEQAAECDLDILNGWEVAILYKWQSVHNGVDTDYWFYNDLQMAHDDLASAPDEYAKEIENRLREFARRWKLTIPE